MAISGIINTNVNALNTLNALGSTSSNLSTYIQQLSTGKQINGPADNPAGYAISQRFQTQINGLNQAVSNGNQAVSLVQTATGALQNETNLLQQIRTIAVQSANGSNTASDRKSLQGVVSQLLAQVSTIATQTQFNGQNILDGSFSGQQFQVGANANQVINVSIANSQGNSIGLNTVGSGVTPGGTTGLFDGVNNGDLTNNGYGVAYTISAGGAYVANAGGIAISGAVGSATTAATNQKDSASIIASDINKISSQTGVTATASTAAVFKATDGSYTFSLQTSGVGGAGTTVSVTANVANGDLSGLTSAINNTTAQTGISASVDSNGNLKLSQGSGDNISITGFSGTGSLQAVNAKGVALAASNALLGNGGVQTALIQGAVQVQSTSGFSLDATAAGNIGLAAVSGLTSASNVNVSTVEGANAALAVIDSAINALNQQGGALGAIQNRIQASVQNVQTTATNLQAAQSVVQDANIAQATTQLSKYQILQQAGISTLAQANSLQQSYLKLLP